MEDLLARLALEDPSQGALLPPQVVHIFLRQLNDLLAAEGPVSCAEASRRLGAAGVNRLWREAALAEIRLNLLITQASELSNPLLTAMPIAALHLQPAAGQLAAELAAALAALLGSPAFRERSGATLATLSGLPMEALEWSRGGVLDPYSALQEVGIDLRPQAVVVPVSMLGPTQLGRLRMLRLTARQLYLHIEDPQPRLLSQPIGGGLGLLLAHLEPALLAAATRHLLLEAGEVGIIIGDPGSSTNAASVPPLVNAEGPPYEHTQSWGMLTGSVRSPGSQAAGGSGSGSGREEGAALARLEVVVAAAAPDGQPA